MCVKALFLWGEPQNTCVCPSCIMNYSSVFLLLLKVKKKNLLVLKRLFVTAWIFLKSFFLCFLIIFEQQEISTVLYSFLLGPFTGDLKEDLVQCLFSQYGRHLEHTGCKNTVLKRQGRKESRCHARGRKRPRAKQGMGSKFRHSKWLLS